MKKKYRDIEVNGQQYAWKAYGSDYKIWKNKKVVKEGESNTDVILPMHIRGIIEKYEL
tara:strand:+ start:85 stop:258 length:174 start_codon:yes stop_codon:yes gene_type:complete